MMKKMALTALGVALAFGGVVSALAVASSASTPANGVVTGRVYECGPGPIVASPAPKAIPAYVTLRHDGKNIEVAPISFTSSPPWRGPFTFLEPPGRYEVISSYLHQTAWVRVRSGETSVVHFGPFACPMQSAS
jgi:hypothetical protein